MITRDNLPKSYSPYEKLVVCSNTLSGGGHILAIGEVLPVLVGKGEKPQVWLQALSNPDKSEFIIIVEASISKHQAVKVFEDNGVLNIHVGSTSVLSVRVTGEDIAEIIVAPGGDLIAPEIAILDKALGNHLVPDRHEQ